MVAGRTAVGSREIYEQRLHRVRKRFYVYHYFYPMRDELCDRAGKGCVDAAIFFSLQSRLLPSPSLAIVRLGTSVSPEVGFLFCCFKSSPTSTQQSLSRRRYPFRRFERAARRMLAACKDPPRQNVTLISTRRYFRPTM